MNDPSISGDRPASHSRLIALLQAAAPPPPDADTPAIPDEVLRRLREQYGAARPVRETTWTRIRRQIQSHHLALAATLLLLGVLASLSLPSRQTGHTALPPVDVRGGDPVKAPEAPAYWLAGGNAAPAPTGLGLPKFTEIHREGEIPQAGLVFVFDPLQRQLRLMENGKPKAAMAVDDVSDGEAWLDAHRQMLKLLKP